MLLKTYLGLAAVAMTPASAFDFPNFAQAAIDSGLALAGLNSIALLNSFTHMKGTCNIANVKFRQEWYVFCRALPLSLLTDRSPGEP